MPRTLRTWSVRLIGSAPIGPKWNPGFGRRQAPLRPHNDQRRAIIRITHTKFLYKINAIITNDVIRKTVLLNIVCLTGIAFLLPMGLLASLQHNYYLWITDWVLAFFLAGNLFYLRISGNLNHVVWINISLMMVFFFYLLSSGGVNNTAFVWYYVFPLFSLFLLGTPKRHFGQSDISYPVCLFSSF